MDVNLETALIEQYTHERGNAAFYESIANSFEQDNWRGFAAWNIRQADQEREHAAAFRGFLIDRNLYPPVQALEAFPLLPGKTPIARFADAQARERDTSQRIREIYYLAEQAEDPETVAFIHPWLLEQVEEERKLLDILGDLQHAGDDSAALLALDRSLGG